MVLFRYRLNCQPLKTSRQHFSVVMERLRLELRGTPCLSLENPQPRKSIIVSRSFSKRVTELQDLTQAISCHAVRAAEKLRQQKSCVSEINIFITTNPFSEAAYYSNSLLHRFMQPTDDSRQIVSASIGAIQRLYRKGFHYKKVGVVLQNLTPHTFYQGDLFQETNDPEKRKAKNLMKLLDGINQQMSKNTLFLAAQGIVRPWRIKRQYCPPCYTTRWDQLLKVD